MTEEDMEELMYYNIERIARRRRIDRIWSVINRYWLAVTWVVLVVLLFMK